MNDDPALPSRKRRRVERETRDDEDAFAEDDCENVYVPPSLSAGLQSPTMAGKTVDMFRGKDVLYLLTFHTDDKTYIKFGRTQDVERRMRTHLVDYPEAQIWCIHDCACSMFDLENRFKTRMRHLGHLVELSMNGKRKVEILQNILPVDAEQVLLNLKEELESNDQRKLTMQHINMHALAYKASALWSLMNIIEAPLPFADLKTILGLLFSK